MNVRDNRTFFIGVDTEMTKMWGLGAVALLVASISYFAAIKTLDFPEFHSVLWWEGFAALLVSVIAVQAYSNEGLLVSWTIAAAALIGVTANYGGIGITESPPELVELAGLIAVGSLVGGLIFGTLGFAIGWMFRVTLSEATNR
ncbi:hypothetical protein NGM10_04890 [Halorussus salilacus]|uniref:hypothetical protein n=1 Tax=Halorussus salilacus TaxID=2953750 RepID=UPI00209D2710|nr:hypothetical protein [Halorussus salilacus]USZ69075.1 hypothetical protein NGM10_04890 [Halorussus salilacus]